MLSWRKGGTGGGAIKKIVAGEKEIIVAEESSGREGFLNQ